MSLLMDALRKAEEAKRKAEKADLGQGEQDQVQVEQSAEDDKDLLADPVQQRDESPYVTPKNEPEPPTLIPNVKIEFQQTGEEDREQQISAASKGADSEVETTASDLSLEPIDTSLSTQARQPFDQTITPDYTLEAPGTSIGSKSGSAYNSPATEEASGSTAKKGDEEDVAQDPDTQAIAYAARSTADQFQNDSPAADTRYSAPNPSPTRQAEPSAPVEKESRSRASRPDASFARSKTQPNPNLRSNPEASSVVARSAADRRSARAVFAAKQQGKGQRFRIRRSTRIWAAQIAAVVILLSGGAYLYLSISSNSNSFNVPQEYLANQDAYSMEFNDELEAAEEAAIEPEPSLDELAAVAEELLPENIDIEDLPLPGQISEVVDDVTDAATVVITEEITALDVGVGTVQPEQEQELAANEVLVPQVEADAESETRETTPVTEAPLASNSFQSSQQTSAPISFSRAQTVNVIDPLLQDAYVAYQRDDLARAQELYQRVLSESPLQRDALLGLAAIATRNGETSLAMELYSRMLARDPSDGVARAGLLGLRPLGGPETQERELRRLLEDHPQVAPVVYALGNFYAGQNRWNEAQRYYFNALQQAKTDALAGIPVNPDYAFNLAVSLERLRQPTVAEIYYREAIAFAADFPAGFDISLARNRLSRLTGRGS